jgi:hypothetical protein
MPYLNSTKASLMCNILISGYMDNIMTANYEINHIILDHFPYSVFFLSKKHINLVCSKPSGAYSHATLPLFCRGKKMHRLYSFFLRTSIFTNHYSFILQKEIYFGLNQFLFFIFYFYGNNNQVTYCSKNMEIISNPNPNLIH